MKKVTNLLRAALPGGNDLLIGGFLASMLDLWETGQHLDAKLKLLEKMQSPRDREAIKDILIWIKAIQLDMGAFWIDQTQETLPRILRALDRTEIPRREK